jgi:hypothetical protein
MATTEALAVLESQLNERIADTTSRRNRDKFKATLLKMSNLLLAGVVTVLIGLQGENFDQTLLRNLALALGALITVVNAFDAFFDHRSLWIKKTVTLSRLYALKRDLSFEVAKAAPDEPQPQTMQGYHERLGNILEDDLREWIKLRAETDSIGNAPSKKRTDGKDIGEIGK